MANYIVVHSVRVCTEFVPETFGRLTTLGPAFAIRTEHGRRRTYQVCECECGAVAIHRCDALGKRTRSCGCLGREINTIRQTKHGLSRSPEYVIWNGIRNRCYRVRCKDYPRYGGQGIQMCDRWHRFENFLEDVGTKPSPDHSIDRFPDKDGNYEPGNWRWATTLEQNNNKRTNKSIEIAGIVDTLANWCRIYKIDRELVKHRLKLGWSTIATFTTPT